MTILPTQQEMLRDAVHGRVVLPTDADFEHSHRPWNLAIEQEVCAVVEASDADDISRLVKLAARQGLSIATQPSGHGATGRADGAILLRTSTLDSISIDPITRTARIGAGVRSGDLQRATATHGLSALPGSSPVVTVTGAALGGGLSWFGRAFGWMADSVLAFDIVAADGTQHHVTEDTDPELWWALRGGGGDLAIVTAMEVQLHHAPTIFGGRQLWSAAHAPQVANVFQSLTASAPNELTLWLELLSFPGSEPMVAIDSTYLGDDAAARELLRETDALPAPLADTRAVISAADLGTITAEPTDPSPGQSRAELLHNLNDGTLAALLDEEIRPLLSVQIRHLGGALSRASDSPHGPLSEPFAVYMFGAAPTGEVAETIRIKQAALADKLPTSGRKPLTFLNQTERLSDALPAASMRRLRDLKKVRDPGNVVCGNVGILD